MNAKRLYLLLNSTAVRTLWLWSLTSYKKMNVTRLYLLLYSIELRTLCFHSWICTTPTVAANVHSLVIIILELKSCAFNNFDWS